MERRQNTGDVPFQKKKIIYSNDFGKTSVNYHSHNYQHVIHEILKIGMFFFFLLIARLKDKNK